MSTLTDRISQALAFFQNAGYSLIQSQGIVGNLQWESGLNPNENRGDGGRAYGIAEWHGSRQPARGSSFLSQLQHVADELSHGYGGPQLRQATTVSQATEIFGRLFERPAVLSSSLSGRIALANQAGQIGGGSGNIGNGGDWGSWGITLPGIGTIGDPGLRPDWWNDPASTDQIAGDLTSGLSSLLTSATGARFVAVVVGVLLIGVALIALILTNGNPGQAVNLVTNKAKEGLSNATA